MNIGSLYRLKTNAYFAAKIQDDMASIDLDLKAEDDGYRFALPIRPTT
jgi:formate dehydrogenase maturation protein FdhE